MEILRFILLGIGLLLYITAKFYFARDQKKKMQFTIAAIVIMLLAFATYLPQLLSSGGDSGAV